MLPPLFITKAALGDDCVNRADFFLPSHLLCFVPYGRMRADPYKLTRIRVNFNMNTDNDQPLTLMKVRQLAEMTQKEWADLLGVTISTVSNWERGVQVPRLTFEQTRRIMKASGLSIDQLAEAFEGTQSARNSNSFPGGESDLN